jgi:hypothetical protein
VSSRRLARSATEATLTIRSALACLLACSSQACTLHHPVRTRGVSHHVHSSKTFIAFLRFLTCFPSFAFAVHPEPTSSPSPTALPPSKPTSPRTGPFVRTRQESPSSLRTVPAPMRRSVDCSRRSWPRSEIGSWPCSSEARRLIRSQGCSRTSLLARSATIHQPDVFPFD